MSITIASTLKPFSHTPGARCLLPGTGIIVEAYPAKLRFFSIAHREPYLLAEIDIHLESKMNQFTLQQDLKTGEVHLFGKTTQGMVRFSLRPCQNNLCAIAIHRHPEGGLIWHTAKGFLFRESALLQGSVIAKDLLLLSLAKEPVPFHAIPKPQQPKLSLGMHKAQRWDDIVKRGDPREYLPYWFSLGDSSAAALAAMPHEGTADLLHKAQQFIAQRQANAALEELHHFFQAGFDSWLIPRLLDKSFLGRELPRLTSSDLSPLPLLHAGSRLIQDLFITIDGSHISILPSLPSLFHCGRLLHIPCAGKGWIDIEWSKHLVRRIIFWSETEEPIQFSFSKELKRFRLKESLQDRGAIYPCPATICFKKHRQYILDHFEK
jgi:hypothetical protein